MTSESSAVEDYKDYVGVNVMGFELTDSMRSHMSGPWRVWTVALAHLNNWGHAPFKPGQLASEACGKDTPSNRAMVNRWIDVLANMGWVKARGKFGSTQLCIVVNWRIARRKAGRASDYLCSEPTHMDYKREMWPRATKREQSEDEREYTPDELKQIAGSHELGCDCTLCATARTIALDDRTQSFV